MASKKRNPGIRIRKISFQQLIAELASGGNFFYILHEKGEDIARVKLKEKPVFVLGDHIGLPRKEEKNVERFEHEKISLGTTSYHTSQCITVLHYEMDKRYAMLRSGFEPESSARKAEMIGRATLPEHN